MNSDAGTVPSMVPTIMVETGNVAHDRSGPSAAPTMPAMTITIAVAMLAMVCATARNHALRRAIWSVAERALGMVGRFLMEALVAPELFNDERHPLLAVSGRFAVCSR